MKSFLYGWGSVMNIRIPFPRVSPILLFTIGQMCAWAATGYIFWTALRLIVKAIGV